MIASRNYTSEQYLNSIKENKSFWSSLRENTTALEAYNKELVDGVAKLKLVYPELRESSIYYTFGAHRSPGTGFDSLVLIGSEFALGHKDVDASGLAPHLQDYFLMNPIEHIQLLTVHEYMHTQQKSMQYDLLSLVLYEGIAEFVAQLATGKKSPYSSFSYGQENADFVRKNLEEDFLCPNRNGHWLWNSKENKFGENDMAYFAGNRIASLYYNKMEDKATALKSLVELDFSNRDAVKGIVDKSGYFSRPIAEIEAEFNPRRPTVIKISEFENGTKDISAGKTTFSITFSEAMDIDSRGFEYGPLGPDHVLRVAEVIGFSDDRKTFTFTSNVESGKRYQSTVSNRFLSESGYPLVPYLIDFETN